MEQIYDLSLRELETYRNNSERAADAQEMETLWNCKGKVLENSHRFGNVLSTFVNC